MALATPSLYDAYRPTTPEAIAAFERKLGRLLPADYRRWLLRSNGGVFHSRVITEDNITITSFHGLNSGYDWADLESSYDSTRAFLGLDLLPIAATPFNDKVCMSLDPALCGSIIAYSSDAGVDEILEIHGVDRTLARDFSTFLLTLRIEPSQEEYEPGPTKTLFEMIDSRTTDEVMSALQTTGQLVRDSSGQTVVHHAAYRSRLDVIDALVESGADMQIKDVMGQSAVVYAVYAGCVECIFKLSEVGVSIDEPDVHGSTPLMIAVDSGMVRSAIALIELGANRNAVNSKGQTAKVLCNEFYMTKYVRHLL